MIKPGTNRTTNSVSSEFVGLDARANTITEENIVAGSIRRSEMSAVDEERPFTHGIVQDHGIDRPLLLGPSDGDKAVSPDTQLAALSLAGGNVVYPGGADSHNGCYGLLVTWSTYLAECHAHWGVGSDLWVGTTTKGPSDSACVVETWVEVGNGLLNAALPGTRRILRAGMRQLVDYVEVDGVTVPVYRLEVGAFLTCDGACFITGDRLSALGMTSVTSIKLMARFVMSDNDYGFLSAYIANPRADLLDNIITAHIVRNAELT